MRVDREHIRQTFDEYAANYNMEDVKINLKHKHTYYVAANAERIARSLKLSEEDIDLAWLLGMFHDIGRFEQLKRYDTFRDNLSVNHAELSADILFKEGLADHFLGAVQADENQTGAVQDRTDQTGESPWDRNLMELAIRCHNRFRLPEDMTERERMFANILRDADKIDILRVNCETPRTEIYDLPEEEFLYSDMTDEVYQAVVNCHEVDRRYSRTGVDFIMGHLGFVYGLVFEESKRIVAEQGNLKKLLGFESRNPETAKRLAKVREAVYHYLEGRAMKYLIVVDVQNDFVNGALGTKEAVQMLPNLINKVKEFDGTVLMTKDTHPVSYLETQEGKLLPVEHCIRGTAGWELPQPLEEVRQELNAAVYEKPTFGSEKLAEDMKKLYQQGKVESIELVGICTDICVISNALLLKAAMPELPIHVDASCCAGVTPEKHEAALQVMESCQILVKRG